MYGAPRCGTRSAKRSQQRVASRCARSALTVALVCSPLNLTERKCAERPVGESAAMALSSSFAMRVLSLEGV